MTEHSHIFIEKINNIAPTYRRVLRTYLTALTCVIVAMFFSTPIILGLISWIINTEPVWGIYVVYVICHLSMLIITYATDTEVPLILRFSPLFNLFQVFKGTYDPAISVFDSINGDPREFDVSKEDIDIVIKIIKAGDFYSLSYSMNPNEMLFENITFSLYSSEPKKFSTFDDASTNALNIKSYLLDTINDIQIKSIIPEVEEEYYV